MEKKFKKIIIVDSLPNLMIAIAIRTQHFRDCVFDIVLSNSIPEVERIISSCTLKTIFDEVYLANTDALNRMDKKIWGILSLKCAINKIIGTDLVGQYDDLFFWNPNTAFTCIYLYLKNNNKDMNVHVYSDCFVGFFREDPFALLKCGYPVYCDGTYDRLFRLRNGEFTYNKLSFDYYMFRSDISPIIRRRRTIDVSTDLFRRPEMIKIINNVFGYDSKYTINQKYILLLGVPGETKAEETLISELNVILKWIKPEKLYIKPHPRTPVGYYDKYRVRVAEKAYPWELYCMNNELSDKVIIADDTSAVFLSALLMHRKMKVIWLRDIQPYKEWLLDEKYWKRSLEEIEKEGCINYTPTTISELECTIKEVI